MWCSPLLPHSSLHCEKLPASVLTNPSLCSAPPAGCCTGQWASPVPGPSASRAMASSDPLMSECPIHWTRAHGPAPREARRCLFLWWECCLADSIWLFRAHRWGPIISRGMLCSLRPGHRPPAPAPPELAFIAKSLLSVLQQEITQQLKSGCPAQLRNPGIDASVTRLGVTRVSARPLRPAPTCFLTWNPGPSLFPGLQIHGLMQSMSRMWPVGPEMAPAGQDPSHAGSVRWWASQPGAAWTGWSRLIFSQEPGRLTGILAVNTAYHSQVEAKGDEAGNGFHSSKADTSWEGYPGKVGGLMCGESRCFSLMRI